MSSLLLSRRAVLAGGAALFAWPYAVRAGTAPQADPRLLVVVLRGGMDGLAAVPPLGDPGYAALRQDFAQGADGATLPLDGFFALPAAMETLAATWREGHALIVHAAATPYRSRSHFEGQDMLESGFPELGRASPSGWLNRSLGLLQRGDKSRPGAIAATPVVPLILRGEAPVETWQPQRMRSADDDLVYPLLDLYEKADPVLAEALRTGADLDRLAVEAGTAAMPATRVPGRPDFTTSAAAAARFMSRPDGPRIGVLGYDGWDTHIEAGPVAGRLARQFGALDDAIKALKTGFAPVWDQTVILVVTEFGRTAAINGTRGTDHGTATAAYLIGGAVKGGRVIADWPGLAPKDLHEGRDLKPTTDLRAVAKGVLKDHLGLAGTALDTLVFPGSATARPLEGLIRG